MRKSFVVLGLAAALMVPQVANAELLAWLAGDVENGPEPRIIVDSSKKGNHGAAVVNTFLTADGKNGGGIDFGSGNSYMILNTSTAGGFDAITDNQEFTIAFWMAGEESAAGPSNSSTFWFNSPANNNGARGIQSHVPWSNGQVYLDIGGCCGATQRVNGPIDRDFWDANTGEEWTHYTYTMNADGDAAVYIDGVEELFRAGPTDNIGEFAQIYFGVQSPGTSSWQGRLDDIVVASNGLDIDEVETLFNQGPAAVWPDDVQDPPTNIAPVSPIVPKVAPGGNLPGDFTAAITGLVRGPGGDEYAPGLAQEWSQSGNAGNRNAIQTSRLNAGIDPPPFRAADTDWWYGDTRAESTPFIDAGIPSYPADLEAAGYQVGDSANNDQYSVVLSGEIRFPENGTYKFRDGMDDYTYFAVDMDRSGVAGDSPDEVLVDDNAWVGINAVRNSADFDNPSPEANVEIDGVTGDESTQWVAIELMMAEGGGGDAGALFWNGLDKDNFLFEEPGLLIDDPDLLVPQSHTRSKLPGPIVGVEAKLDTLAVYEMTVSSDLRDSDHIVVNAPGGSSSTLDLTGVSIEVVADGGVESLVDGDQFVLFAADNIVGLTAETLNLDAVGGADAWDISGLLDGSSNRITFGAGPGPGLPADFDGNGTVDFADFLFMSSEFGNTVDPPGTPPDIDGSGTVDFPDFLVLSSTFGQSAGAASAVPEPTSLTLLGLGGLLLGLVRRRRK